MVKQISAIFGIAFLIAACETKTSEPEIEVHVEHGEFTDSRDGQTYKTVTIESQTWMAENLNYKTDKSFCYNNVTDSCNIYGRLYSEYRFNNDYIELCPEGWHTPNREEWIILFETVGGTETAGIKLHSSDRWMYSWGIGENKYGFSILPAGEKCSNFDGVNKWATFWVSKNSANYDRVDITWDRPNFQNFDRDCAFSIRCIKD